MVGQALKFLYLLHLSLIMHKYIGAVSHLKNRYKGQEVTPLKTIFVQI